MRAMREEHMAQWHQYENEVHYKMQQLRNMTRIRQYNKDSKMDHDLNGRNLTELHIQVRGMSVQNLSMAFYPFEETCYYVRLRLLSHHQVHYTSRQPLDKLDGRTCWKESFTFGGIKSLDEEVSAELYQDEGNVARCIGHGAFCLMELFDQKENDIWLSMNSSVTGYSIQVLLRCQLFRSELLRLEEDIVILQNRIRILKGSSTIYHSTDPHASLPKSTFASVSSTRYNSPVRYLPPLALVMPTKELKRHSWGIRLANWLIPSSTEMHKGQPIVKKERIKASRFSKLKSCITKKLYPC